MNHFIAKGCFYCITHCLLLSITGSDKLYCKALTRLVNSVRDKINQKMSSSEAGSLLCLALCKLRQFQSYNMYIMQLYFIYVIQTRSWRATG